MKHAAETYDPIFDKYLKMDVKAVAANPEANGMGQRLFLTYCSQCHGSDAGGSRGFPNLTDKDWLYGGDPETIKASITTGRGGIMPPHGPVLGDAGVKEVANYVFSLSGHKHDATLAAAGKPKFEQVCAACHTPAGTGMQALGAPNLTDKIWLYGGSEGAVIDTITKGRNGVMPAWKDFLGEAKIHLLTAYVYGLSQNK
jgi:cytochrome c oxidase cbb3-type subunit 3